VASLQGVKEKRKRKEEREKKKKKKNKRRRRTAMRTRAGEGEEDHPPQRDHVNARNGAYSEMSSSSTLWAT
jgi:hypothetical protein